MQSAVSARQFCGCFKAIYMRGDSSGGKRRDALRIHCQGFPEVHFAPPAPVTSGGKAGAPGVRDCGGAGWWPFRLLEPAREGGADAIRCSMREALGRQLGRGTVG